MHDGNAQGRRVLLVDDEEILRRLLARMLADDGWDVVQAENGARALDVTQGLDGTLSLVVTDVHMPVMNGLEFARAFRQHHPGIPILYITGRDWDETVDLDVTPGILLRKPFHTEVFLDTVRRAIHRH
jgi:CheY-like chemotaxis protein